MFVWVFHRVSGVILLLLMALKFLTGFGLQKQLGDSTQVVEFWRAIHASKILDLILLFFFTFHSMYGLRTILYDLGIKKEKELFWGATILGALIFVVLGLRFYLHS